MTSIDKVGIGITIVIVAIALGFTTISNSGSSNIAPIMEKTTSIIEETNQDIRETGNEALQKVKETTKQVIKETIDFEETTKELTTSKLPARLVSIPKGTSVPGCEKAKLCYDPQSLIIFVGGEIIWKNDDSSSHTVTSGNIIDGPDGKFDSGLIKVGETFSFRFENPGKFDYFCMIHPWANGSINVN